MIQSSGVDCNPHCYLLCSCELLRIFVYEGKMAILVLKLGLFGATVQNLVARHWCILVL